MQQFAAIVDNNRPEQHIGEVLKRLSGGKAPSRILCTGHSLGGALATLGELISHPSSESLRVFLDLALSLCGTPACCTGNALAHF